MIFSVDVKFEALDLQSANAVRHEVSEWLDGLDQTFSVSGPYEVAPLVVFDEDENV
jgi:hypothetical protein